MRNLLQTKVGLRIKDLRAAAGLSQERFALKIGMGSSFLFGRSRGPSGRPRCRLSRSIARNRPAQGCSQVGAAPFPRHPVTQLLFLYNYRL